MLKRLKSTKPKYIRKALNDLPYTLDATYEQMLLQVNELLKEEALTALRWLAFETRPLTLGELAEACLIDLTREDFFDVDNRGQADDLLDILAGLVLLEDSSLDGVDDSGGGRASLLADREENHPDSLPGNTNRRIRLAHFSVKEYLLSSRILESKVAIFHLQEGEGCRKLAQNCIAYVLYYCQSPLKTGTDEDLRTFPFLQYAAETWTELIPKHGSAQPALEKQLLLSERHRRIWSSIYKPEEPWEKPFQGPGGEAGNALYYASLIGSLPLCELTLGQGADANAQGGRYCNALYAASYRGNREVVDLLLHHGADVDARGGELGKSTALQAASSRGSHDVVKLLLKAGADVNAGRGHFGTALFAASSRGHRETTKLLLDAGADVNDCGLSWLDQSALLGASAGGHREVVRLLLDAGADVDAGGSRDPVDNPLTVACVVGDEEIVKLLLDAGANIDACAGYFDDALMAASRQRHLRIVELLLDASKDHGGQTKALNRALHDASSYGDEKVVKFLLDAGADVNVSCRDWLRYDRNVLEKEGVRISRNILKAVFQHGPCFDNWAGSNPARISIDHQKILKTVLGIIAVLVSQSRGENDLDSSAVQDATLEGHEEIVQLLQGAQAETSGEDCDDELDVATLKYHLQAMNLEPDVGSDDDTDDEDLYGSPLQAASYGGHKNTVQLLLDSGAHVNAHDGGYGNALQAASAGGCTEIVKLLLDKGADIDAQGGCYGTALQAALKRDHREVVSLLTTQKRLTNSRSDASSAIQERDVERPAEFKPDGIANTEKRSPSETLR